jgi:hypothetical protein
MSNGTCPVCIGTKRIPYVGKYAHITAAYDANTQTIPCYNCGGQYMSMTPTGTVALRPDGTPCTHAYKETGPMASRQRGWHEYT